MPASVWKGFLSFGLVSFPVRLGAAARRDPIRFHMLHKTDLARIKEVWYCSAEDKPVDKSAIVKGYEYAKNEYVTVEDAELKKIAPPTAETIEIIQFVREQEVDPILLDKSYHLLPEEKVSKPYALFLAALNETKFYAIGKIAMHGREHIAVIRRAITGLALHTLYYADELHQPAKPEGRPKNQFNKQELDLAKRLVDSLASPFKLDAFHDTYRDNVERLIEQKQKGEKITAPKRPKAAGVTNILDALKRSLRESAAATPKRRTRKAA